MLLKCKILLYMSFLKLHFSSMKKCALKKLDDRESVSPSYLLENASLLLIYVMVSPFSRDPLLWMRNQTTKLFKETLITSHLLRDGVPAAFTSPCSLLWWIICYFWKLNWLVIMLDQSFLDLVYYHNHLEICKKYIFLVLQTRPL